MALNLNSPAVRKKLDICMIRLKNPDLPVEEVAGFCGCDVGAVRRALAWGERQGVFGRETARQALEVKAARDERIKHYNWQLREMWKRQKVDMELLRELEEEPPEEFEDARVVARYLESLEKLRVSIFGRIREQAIIEAMLFNMEQDSFKLVTMIDAVVQEVEKEAVDAEVMLRLVGPEDVEDAEVVNGG